MPCNYKNYPPNWFTEIRPRILERAKNCCEQCFGEINKKPKAKLTKIILTIAHLDHDKENFEVTDDRLKALCQRYHLILDKEHHAEKRRETINKKKGLKNLF